MSIRSMMDKVAPHFEKGGKFEALYPAFEAIDTALYTPGQTTHRPSHVRDGLDLKRIMIKVWMCAFIPVFAGSYVVWLQANEVMQSLGIESVDNWRGLFLDNLTSYDPTSIWDCVLHGLAYFLPLYVTVFVAGWPWVDSWTRLEPVSPPISISSRESTRSAAFSFSGPWHFTHLAPSLGLPSCTRWWKWCS